MTAELKMLIGGELVDGDATLEVTWVQPRAARRAFGVDQPFSLVEVQRGRGDSRPLDDLPDGQEVGRTHALDLNHS